MISIVVTHYKEPWKTVEPLFDSLKEQLGYDLKELEVILIHDGTDLFPNEILDEYPFKVIQRRIEHKGISGARNEGLDISLGEYVMFCDCDDRFISAYGLHSFEPGFGHYDIIHSPFIEDLHYDGKIKLVRHDNDVSFIHGKMYRREFLKEKNLRFDESLTIHEDGYFNVIAHTEAEDRIYEMAPAVYLWKYNEESTVRKNSDLYIYKTYSNLMDSRLAICRELHRRGYITEYFQSVAKTVIDAYYDFQKPEALEPKNKETIKKAEKEFARAYQELRDDYNDMSVMDIANIMMVCRGLAYKNGLRIEQETLSQFVTRIVKEYL